jgi:Family of unknown function (DUF6049)
VDGVLPVRFARRCLAAAAVVPAAAAAVFGLASPAQAGPAQASTAQASTAQQARAGALSVTIDSMTPQVARPGSTVSLTGTVSNDTSRAVSGLSVQLYSAPTEFSTRDGMDAFLSQGSDAELEPAGSPFVLSASVAPGTAVNWRAAFQVATVGISEFGVYPVAAQVEDQAGDVLAADQTLLPFWPGQQAAGLERRLQIAWIWPLIDQPRAQVCPGLANNSLTASLGQGGRLSTLLMVGAAYPDADLTWVIDPALLGDVHTMTRSYQVGAKPNCTGAATKPASKAAIAWLSALRAVTSSQQVVLTPYADVDAAALADQGLTADLARAYTTGNTVAGTILHGSFGSVIALPAGGTADLSLLTDLSTVEHVGTVVLRASAMPPSDSTVFEPDDAVSSVRTDAGTTMNVLLADDTLTGVLAAGDTSSGSLSPGTEFAVSQRFLAETAMIAAEAPDSDRSIVVDPPAGWSPSAGLASELLDETVTAPWLAPAALGSLAGSPNTDRNLPRESPPRSSTSPGELSAGYLATVSRIGAQLRVYRSMLYQAGAGYLLSLDEALAATESSAWRGAGVSGGQALAGSLSAYLTNAEGKVKIITTAQVPMGGASGEVPVSIQNGLKQAIQVRLNASVVNVRGQASQLTIGRFQKLITVQPQTAALVRLSVKSAPIGPTAIRLTLTSADGTPLPFTSKSLTVLSTRYGRAILFLIGAAIGVLVLTSAYRGLRRRWLRAGAHAAAGQQDPPGSVMAGTAGARHPTEAPDDLADARRWADDA